MLCYCTLTVVGLGCIIQRMNTGWLVLPMCSGPKHTCCSQKPIMEADDAARPRHSRLAQYKIRMHSVLLLFGMLDTLAAIINTCLLAWQYIDVLESELLSS